MEIKKEHIDIKSKRARYKKNNSQNKMMEITIKKGEEEYTDTIDIRESRNAPVKAEKIIDKLSLYSCNISKTARALGVQRHDVDHFIKNNPDLELLMNQFEEEMFDQAQENIRDKVMEGDAKFSLELMTKTKRGRARGYGVDKSGGEATTYDISAAEVADIIGEDN